jgi:hypothetical protein
LAFGRWQNMLLAFGLWMLASSVGGGWGMVVGCLKKSV